MVKRTLVGCFVAGVVLFAGEARADTFAQGSLIVPMDTTYQDNGMLRAFGLVYELLRNGVHVQWVIRPGKAHLGVDFTASAVDHQTRAVVASHGYRGGPWVIDSSDAAKAIPIIDAWQQANPAVAVHEVTAPFWGDVARYLVVAPTIAMHQDGNEKIARGYLQAAGIPDSTLDPTWPATSPDMLTPAEVAGPTTTNHHDGKLFDADGDPVYCQFMSMHWGVNEAAASPETVLEVREYLKHPVHFFAECQAVNAFEGGPPDGGRGNFLTTQGFQWPAPAQPKTYDFYNDSSPFAQLDGAFQSVGGSEPAYSLPAGGAYKSGGVVMITKSGTPEGDSDVWMTGFLDGACPPDREGCANNYGKVSYLGGHQYSTSLPISKNPQTQGTRLFLNSLFEAPCATDSGQPSIDVTNVAPGTTGDPTVTFTLYYANWGSGIAISGVLSDPLPSGATFVSASAGYVLTGNTVSWNVGNLGSFESGQVTVTVRLSGFGTYSTTAHLAYKVGLNSFVANSNTTNTTYDTDNDGDGIVNSLDVCPNNYNPAQNLQSDTDSCGSCGTICSAENGIPACNSGTCAIGMCLSGYSDCDGLYVNGCEHLDIGQKCCDCAPANGSGACVAGACTITSCSTGFSDCDKLSTTGCEYDNSNFQTDPDHCGGCDTKCSFANAAALCVAGSCKIGNCSGTYADADGNPANGCECLKLGAADTTCDGIDDDCNGVADDGYVPTTCGIGACASRSLCVAGTIVPCQVGSPSTEGPADDSTCIDSVDNDCNGATDGADANCVAVGGSGGAGFGGATGTGGDTTSSGGSSTATTGGSSSDSGGALGSATGGDNGTGGTPWIATGGNIAMATGGTTWLATGGNIAMATGGTTWIATGGNIAMATGGTTWNATGGNIAVATGGNVGAPTGGSVTIATGGMIAIATGGSLGTASGGAMVATGGSVTMPTGGALAMATGGSVTNATGGAFVAITGGALSNTTGGTADVASGGAVASNTGGTVSVTSGGSLGTTAGGSSAVTSGGSAGSTSGGSVATSSGGMAASTSVGGSSARQSVGGTANPIATSSTTNDNNSIEGGGADNAGGCACRVQRSSRSETFAAAVFIGFGVAFASTRRRRWRSIGVVRRA